MDPITEIAQAVLYEGYLLWPYRRSALKNHRRWTFGGVYPQDYSNRRGEDDPWWMQLQCLVEGDVDARVDVQVRFLHVVERQPARVDGDRLQPVDELVAGEERHLAWQEATERRIDARDLPLAALASPQRVDVAVAAGRDTEWLTGQGGQRTGALVRSWQPLAGTVEITAQRLAPRLQRLTVTIANRTPHDGDDRDGALPHTFVSTHTVVRVAGAELVSLMDPPPGLREAAERCRNVGTWPVLVGDEGERHTMLAAPIILYDYPRVAPESPGDFFDATEIDEMLVFNILGLTDEERREMRDSDPRSRRLLERTAAMSPEEILRLHGAVRELRPVRE